MQPERIFLGWDRPLLASAVSRLAAGWDPARGPLDLGGLLILVPTARSGMLLRERLAEHAAACRSAVLAPRVGTPELILSLAAEPYRLAAPAERAACWVRALQGADPAAMQAVVPDHAPLQETRWLVGAARRLARLQDLLGEVGLSLAEARARLAALGAEFEADRWTQLAALETAYFTALKRLKLADPNAARLQGALPEDSLRDTARIVLLGVTDPLPLTLRQLGDLARDRPVEAWVHAPPEEADAFDEWGRPRPEHWTERELPIPDPPADRRILLAGDAAAQARAAARSFAAAWREASDAAAAVCVPNAALNPHLEVAFRRIPPAPGLATYDPAQEPLATGSIGHFVRALLRVAADPAYANVAELARNPDFLHHLAARREGADLDLPRELDAFQNKRMPATLEAMADAVRREQEAWDRQAARQRRADAETDPVRRAEEQTAAKQMRRELVDILAVRAAVEAVSGWLATLGREAFGNALRAILAAVYRDGRPLPEPSRAAFASAAEAVAGLLDELDRPALRTLKLDPAILAELLLVRLDETTLDRERPEHAVELLGWLELACEDAPHLVIAGFNDPHVPEAVTSDAFLPDAARRVLGLRDNAGRLARDAHLLRAALACRAADGRVTFVVGQTDARGEPLRPSRLLFLCDPATLVERARRLFGEADAEDAPPAPGRPAWLLTPPERPPPEQVSVTAFKTYLACPFRFYLGHVLGMEHSADAATEMDALAFGSLCHAVLEAFGRDPSARASDDPAAIERYFFTQLDLAFEERFGGQPPLALLVQRDSLRRRLAQAARVQAAERRAGWRIAAVEAPFELEARGLRIRGRADRIDRGPDGAIRILDYKTHDRTACFDPRANHVRAGRPDAGREFAGFTLKDKEYRWVDLQLPVYALGFAPQAAYAAAPRVTCAYFNMPKAVTDTAVVAWDDIADYLPAARRTLEEIGRRIRAGAFGPPAERVEYDDFAELYDATLAAACALPPWAAGAGEGAS